MIRAVIPRLLPCLVAANLLIGFAGSIAQEVERPRQKGKRAPAVAEETVKSAMPKELTDHLPIGRTFKGVAIPSYEGDKLKSVMTADTVTRVDEQFLDLVNLIVQVYNAEGKPDTTISMDEAAYDLVAGELASKTPSTIEQPRFTMTGDKMTFHTGSQVARLIGNVRLVVPDSSAIAPDFGLPGANAPKPKDTP